MAWNTGGYDGIHQIIDVTVDVHNMVRRLEDVYTLSVSTKNLILKSTYISGFVKKASVRK